MHLPSSHDEELVTTLPENPWQVGGFRPATTTPSRCKHLLITARQNKLENLLCPTVNKNIVTKKD